MSTIDTLKLALEALESIPEEVEGYLPESCTDAVIAIKQALIDASHLAAPVQSAERGEPVAWMSREDYDDYLEESKVTSATVYNYQLDIPLYTTPPAAPDLQAELDATNRQVEILSDALAESRRQRQSARSAWVGLTDECRKQLINEGWSEYIAGIDDGRTFGEWMSVATEAKLKERNA